MRSIACLQFPISSARRGFSIVEIMFAIMILGIGFIMVAAMFPVAIQQSQANVDQTTGRALAASAGLRALATMKTIIPADRNNITYKTCTSGVSFERGNLLPVTYTASTPAVPPVTTTVYLRDMLYGDMVVQSVENTQGDPRYGATFLYSYNGLTLSIITVALRATNSGQLTLPAVYSYTSSTYDNPVIPFKIAKFIIPTAPGTPTQVQIDTSVGEGAQAASAAIEGAAIVIKSGADGGNIIYLGSPVDGTTDTWELAPNSANVNTSATSVDAFLFGRLLQDPTKPYSNDVTNPATYNPRTGPNPVISVQTVSTSY